MSARRPNPFLRAGLPMLGLTIGGFLGLRFFLQARLDVQVGSECTRGMLRGALALGWWQHLHSFCTPPPAPRCHPPAAQPPASARPCLQDAQRKELDLRAPVTKQRAKKFNLEEELRVGGSSVGGAGGACGAPPGAVPPMPPAAVGG